MTTREQQISVDASPNRCRICHGALPHGGGLMVQGHIDPLCDRCIALPAVVRGRLSPRDVERHEAISETRMLEEAWARIEGIARAAKEDVMGALAKTSALHSAVSDLSTRLADLEARLRRIEEKGENGR